MARAQAVVKSTEVKYISLRELEDSNDRSIYVTNASVKDKPGRGDILFSVPKMNGSGADLCRVVKTWIPQDLTEQIPKAQILSASQFRKTVRDGLVKILHPKYAEKILDTEDAISERQRIENLKQVARNAMRAEQTTRNGGKEDEDEETGQRKTPTQKRRESNAERQVEETANRQVSQSGQSSFTAFLATLEGKDETAVLNMLRSDGGFTERQLTRLIARFKAYPRVVKWCNRQLED